MNFKMIRFLLSRMMMTEALLLTPSLIVTIVYGEKLQNFIAFFVSIVAIILFSIALGIKQPRDNSFYIEEGFIVTSLGWILMSLFGALPFVISGAIPSIVDAFFETSSGFTTTGASILTDVEALSHSMLFWRSFTHLVGGMGVLVFMLAILPVSNSSIHIMKAEVPGPTFGKLLSRINKTARVLYTMYIALTAALVLALIVAGMPLFDSLVHAFGTAGTGGFGIKSTSILHYNSPAIEMILAVGMLMFGINFNLYYLIMVGQFKSILKNEELRWYLGIIALAFLLISMNTAGLYDDVFQLFRDVFFTISSIITTTGFSTANFDTWPLFSKIILLFLMFSGAMSGSTGGGFKVSRIAIYIKTAIIEFKRALNPSRVLHVNFEGKRIENDMLKKISFYLLLYISLYSLVLFAISLDLSDFESAFSAVSACINNIGPGFGSVGPTQNYSALSDLSKIILSLTMIAGRLEIIPMVILFAPSTWKFRNRTLKPGSRA